MKLNDGLFLVAEKFLKMPLEEKRNHYECSKHTTLEEVKTWQQLAEEELLKTEQGNAFHIYV
jgi:hypothetical protein